MRARYAPTITPCSPGVRVEGGLGGSTTLMRGAHLSHAARCVSEAQQLLLAAALHLEFANIDRADIALAELLKRVGGVAATLQSLVDEFGSAEVARCAGATEKRRASP